MREPADVEAAVAACVETLGRVDILVNNVGGSEPGGPAEMSVAAWDEQLALNLRTAFLGCKFALPAMLAQGSGVIVNVASIAGIRELPGRVNVAYSASKAGGSSWRARSRSSTPAMGFAPTRSYRGSCTRRWSSTGWPTS